MSLCHNAIVMNHRIAFSTLGCPEWDLDRILRGATEYGYDAVELRGYRDRIDLTQAEPFLPSHRERTRQRFAEAGIGICCVSSSGVVAEGNLDHVRAHVELARDLGAPLVRVFGGNLPEDEPREEALDRFATTLRAFGEAARAEAVTIVLETHDAFSVGQAVAELLERTAHPSVFALWDLHHPYRQGESPEETDHYLAGKVLHTHLKDSRNGTYTLLGEGDVPLFAMLDLLARRGYEGVLCLEWEKRWISSLAPPETAFPQFVSVMKRYLAG
ncbi:MAG: sugar phosphate isomerase/epimerase family protein [Capsulimonadales bacterium]|nr:sugar phosphate isomerase/epimerase family protein [Capsulimonadales bacterium]